MSQATDYLENQLLNHYLGTTTYTKPTNTFLALFTTAPTDAGGGTEVSTGTGYARQQLSFGAASGGVATNNTSETFTASVSGFGTVTHFAIFDAVTGGNMLTYGTLTAARTVNTGESLVWNTGSLTQTIV